MQTTFNEKLEREIQDGSEYLYGAVETDLALIPTELRLRYAPDGVLQFNNLMDTMGCASRAVLNILESKLNYFYDHGMHPNLKAWCDAQGYRVGGKFVLCDAFIEILSGTTKQGNSLKAPVDTVYRHGVIPAHHLPLKDGMTWEQYMAPERVTEAHKRLGQEFLRRFRINYEKVPRNQFLEALKEDLLDVAGHGWPAPVNGVYPRSEVAFNHAFALATNSIAALDNYLPFTKTLAKDFLFFDWGYSLSITNQNPFPDETVSLFETLQKYGLLAFFAEALRRFTEATDSPALPPVVPRDAPRPSTPPPTPPLSLEPLIQALIEVESGGDDWAVGDRHLIDKAYGPLQIRRPVCIDVNRKLGTQYRPQDMLGNRQLSITVFKAYMDIYCTAERLGRAVTNEDRARVWNGGPTAWEPGNKMYKATNAYWDKVKALL